MSKVSVIIPTYNGSDFLGEAIQSVLEQTHSNFEILIVNDASPDNTDDVIARFPDPRIKYIVHETNKGSDIARFTAMKASSGEIIALLDQDDYFHPEKLQAHVDYFRSHPEVGFTYNARFELDYSAKTIRDIARPPKQISLADLVLWFPLSPSDVVMRRDWAEKMDLELGSRGAEILHFSNLYMLGCKFASVDRGLNYRRYHSGRKVNNLVRACESEIRNQVLVFEDTRCPPDVLALRDIAHANIYMYWAYLAFVQDETDIGQEFVRKAAAYKPSILTGKPGELFNNLLTNCIDDESLDHENLVRKVFNQLPPEMANLTEQSRYAVALGYLQKGARAVLWDRPEAGRNHFDQAARLGATAENQFLNGLAYRLMSFELEYGSQLTQVRLKALASHLQRLGGQDCVRRLYGYYGISRSFKRYHNGEFSQVPLGILRAIFNNPRYLANRGVLSVLIRSIFQSPKKPIRYQALAYRDQN